MCECIERAVAQRGSDYTLRFECGGTLWPLTKIYHLLKSLHHQAHPKPVPWNKTSCILSDPPVSVLIEWSWWGSWSHTSLLRFHLCSLHSSQSQSAGIIWSEKVHNFCWCYVVLSCTANRSPVLIISVTSTCRRTDFLPLNAGVLIVALHVHAHTAAARRTEINWCNNEWWRPSFRQKKQNFFKVCIFFPFFNGPYILKYSEVQRHCND